LIGSFSDAFEAQWEEGVANAGAIGGLAGSPMPPGISEVRMMTEAIPLTMSIQAFPASCGSRELDSKVSFAKNFVIPAFLFKQ
jgi:hypothetical protein